MNLLLHTHNGVLVNIPAGGVEIYVQRCDCGKVRENKKEGWIDSNIFDKRIKEATNEENI